MRILYENIMSYFVDKRKKKAYNLSTSDNGKGEN